MAFIGHTTATFLFLRLPFEIQYQICSEFCRHCKYMDQPLQYLHSEGHGSDERRTLRNLSLVSRHMRDLAQPIYFHCANVWYHRGLFETILKRPDLARCIKVCADFKMIWNRAPYPQLFSSSEETLQFFRETADRLGLASRSDPNYGRCFDWFLDESYLNGNDEWPSRKCYMATDNLITTMYFALLPNLEMAAIDLNDGRWPSPGDASDFKSKPTIEYRFLPRYLEEKGSYQLSTLKCIVFRYAEQDYLFNLGLRRISFLFKYMHNVRTIIFEFANSRRSGTIPSSTPHYPELDWTALPSLQDIYFVACMHTALSFPFSCSLQIGGKVSKFKTVSP